MCSAVPHQHTPAAGLLWFVGISIYTLAAHDISLASISSEVSDDSLVLATGSLSPHVHSTGGVGVPSMRCAIHVPRMHDIVNEYWSQF